MLANVIVSFENMATAIATLKMATFIMAFGEKVAWMSMEPTGGKQREAFMLGIGKKAADMAVELYFLGLDIKKRLAFFKHPNGKRTLKLKTWNQKLSKTTQNKLSENKVQHQNWIQSSNETSELIYHLLTPSSTKFSICISSLYPLFCRP